MCQAGWVVHHGMSGSGRLLAERCSGFEQTCNLPPSWTAVLHQRLLLWRQELQPLWRLWHEQASCFKIVYCIHLFTYCFEVLALSRILLILCSLLQQTCDNSKCKLLCSQIIRCLHRPCSWLTVLIVARLLDCACLCAYIYISASERRLPLTHDFALDSWTSFRSAISIWLVGNFGAKRCRKKGPNRTTSRWWEDCPKT